MFAKYEFAMLRCLPPFGQHPKEMQSEGECEYVGMVTRSIVHLVVYTFNGNHRYPCP